MEFSPEKAERFFSVARNRHDVQSFDYAANMWLQGLRFDPNNVDAVKGFFSSVTGHVSATGAKSPTKDLDAAVSGRTPVHRYLASMLAWSFDQLSSDKAVKTGVAAAELGLREVASYLLPSALKLAMKQDRPRKDHYVKLMEAFEKIDMYDGAVVAGDAAVKMDPTDGKLAGHVKNLAAQSTMNTGGYSKTGDEGGFRSNVRNMDKQRELEDQDRISKTDSVLDRNVATTKAAHLANPSDRPLIARYVKALVERGTADDEETAYALLIRAHKETQEFRFRADAGALRMKQGRRKLRELKAAMDANAGDPAARQAYLDADKAQVTLETAEFEGMVAAYPTNLAAKYELGLRYLAAGRHTDAIGQLQQAKSDGKLKHQAALKLGLAFLAIDWNDEAVETLRTAVNEYPDGNDDMGMELRYELMVALMKKGQASRDLGSAEEADKLASAIGMQNIGYKDIRDKRTAIKALVVELKG
jgi:TolA-binding protein